MGSADHQFNLAELLTQNYSLQEGCAEAPQCPDKPEAELDKDFIDQVRTHQALSSCSPWGPCGPAPCTWFALWPSLRACSVPQSFGNTRACGVSVLLTSSVVLVQVYCPLGTC